MEKIFPEKLKMGDEVRVIAPSRSMALISEETRAVAGKRFLDLGLKLSFGKNVEEKNDFLSSSVVSRVEDFHAAFADKNVKAILTVLGGYNSNQILEYLDWNLLAKNPKIFCGYSDITVLNNAILAKTGLVTFYGPHYSTFGQRLYFDYTLDYFKKCLMEKEPFEVKPSESWSDDLWFLDQKKRELIKNDGWKTINEGEAVGTIVGGNLGTFSLLRGTEYFPKLENAVLFLEDDEGAGALTDLDFERNLQALVQMPDFSGVRGIVIGRFQKKSAVAPERLAKIIRSKKELSGLPVVADFDFGHTDPKFTFPVGGEAVLLAREGRVQLKIEKH
jgi:muramoyltetrapeptide carboxypeptidase LdcA involved in peptidoglycan recycling